MNQTKYALGEPILFDRRRQKKKKKRKSTPILRDAQDSERHLRKATRRTLRAADAGLAAYEKARKKSARKRKDGAIISLLPNVAEGSGVALRKMALVPYDLWQAGYTKQTRRLTRRTMRTAVKLAERTLSR
ncbi:MAG: hypothetical protein GY803_29580 [Chloroflexi bacterium]|nr:hypothetical protein [Chloroflexota bacterium]